jgi:hypothetical protein
VSALSRYRERLAVDPLTLNQLGAIHRRFAALGLDEHRDRPARLAITARLAGVPEVGSTKELTMGEAGRVIRSLDRLLAGAP